MNEEILKSFLTSLGTTPKQFFALAPLLQQILDLIPIRFYLKDLKHQFILANKECVRATGSEKLADVLGKTDFDFFTPLHAEQAFKDEQHIIDHPDQPLIGKEEPETWRDGRQIWVKTWKWPWLEDGVAVGIVGMSAEITTAKDSFDRYRLAAANAHAGLWYRNLETDESWFSPRWKAILGYEDREFPNSHDYLLSRIHPEDVDRMKQTVANHVTGMTDSYYCEFRMRHKNGDWKWIQAQGAITRDAMDRPVFAGSHADITEVKEKLLFYERLVDSVPTLIFVKDDQFRFQFVNKALADVVGVPKDALIGQTDGDINSNADQVAKFRRDDETVLHEKEELEIAEEELFIEKKNTHIVLATKKLRIWSSLDEPPNAPPSKKPLVLGVSVDITPLRTARDEILKGNQQLDFLMKSAPDGIFIKDRTCRFVRVTEALASLAGCTAAEMVGKTDLDLFKDPEYYRESMLEDLEIIQTKKSKSDILRLTPTKKGKRYRLISKVPVLDGQNNVIYIMGISKDVHDIVRNEALLHSVLNTIPQFVFVKNMQGEFELVNRNFATRHDKMPKEMIGKTDFDFWDSPQAKRYQCDDHQVLESNQPRLYYLEEQIFPDGSRRILETSKIPLPNAAGKPDYVLGIYDDVTNRLGEREFQVHGKIIRSLSHCLKHWMAPLEASMLLLPMHASQLKESACYQRLKRQIGIVKEAIFLATNFASLASIPEIKKEPVDVTALVRETAEIFGDIHVLGASTPIYVSGDSAHLRNAIAQLVANAKQALKNTPGAEIVMRVEETEMQCAVHVIDNGPGISAVIRPVLFDLDEVKTKHNPRSTGLGLYYVRCVAHAHGGTVEETASQERRSGAHFVFRLPRTHAPVS